VSVLLFFLLQMSFTVVASDRKLINKIDKISLETGWVQGRPLEPNIYILLRPGLKKGTGASSYLSIQSHSLTGKTKSLKEKLQSSKVKKGDYFGNWIVKSVAPEESCYQLKLENVHKRNVVQYWCFGPSHSYALIESGEENLSENTINKMRKILKEEAAN